MYHGKCCRETLSRQILPCLNARFTLTFFVAPCRGKNYENTKWHEYDFGTFDYSNFHVVLTHTCFWAPLLCHFFVCYIFLFIFSKHATYNLIPRTSGGSQQFTYYYSNPSLLLSGPHTKSPAHSSQRGKAFATPETNGFRHENISSTSSRKWYTALSTPSSFSLAGNDDYISRSKKEGVLRRSTGLAKLTS